MAEPNSTSTEVISNMIVTGPQQNILCNTISKHKWFLNSTSFLEQYLITLIQWCFYTSATDF